MSMVYWSLMKSSLRIRFLQITSSLSETEFFLLMMLVDLFNSNERGEKFEPIGKFDTNYIFNKIFTFR